MDVPGILRQACDTYASRTAVTCAGQHQTYAQLWSRACRLANALLGAGLRPGDRVALLSDNSLGSLEQAAGIALAGMVRAPLYTQNTAETNAYLLDLIDASAVLVQARYAAGLFGTVARPGMLRVVIGAEGGAVPDNAQHYESFLAAAIADDPAIVIDPDADHIIRFSAGTTGKPKGIVHSSRGWVAMGEEMRIILPPVLPDDSYLAAGPLSHAAGLYMWPFVASGARHVVMPAFDPASFLDLVERERCTITKLVPTMIQMVAGVPGVQQRDLSSLRAVLYSAAPITETTLEAGLRLWGSIMYQLYGQSEVLPASILRPEEHTLEGPGRRRLRSAGRPTPHSAITIRDDHDNELPVGQIGEVCIRAPSAMARIWGDPAATRERFTADGAVRTRDMGHQDGEGYLYLDDRKEDMIISGGFNVYPAEVENALASHPAVAEVVVVGIPHPKWGETVAAVVALKQGAVASEAELIEWARGRVGNVRKPTVVRFVTESLPKTGVGKVSRRLVREQHWPDSPRLHGA